MTISDFNGRITRSLHYLAVPTFGLKAYLNSKTELTEGFPRIYAHVGKWQIIINSVAFYTDPKWCYQPEAQTKRQINISHKIGTIYKVPESLAEVQFSLKKVLAYS